MIVGYIKFNLSLKIVILYVFLRVKTVNIFTFLCQKSKFLRGWLSIFSENYDSKTLEIQKKLNLVQFLRVYVVHDMSIFTGCSSKKKKVHVSNGD